MESHRSASLVTREEAHRRALLLGIGALLLLSVSPVFGHHFASGLERGLEGRDHIGALCVIALHGLLQPVHVLFHVLVVAGLAYASYDRMRPLAASAGRSIPSTLTRPWRATRSGRRPGRQGWIPRS